MKRVVLDLETEKLDDPEQIHVLVLRNIDDSSDISVFHDLHANSRSRLLFSGVLDNVSTLIGHNILGFDLRVLNRFQLAPPAHIKIVDTLVVSRLLNYNQPGGHSLDAWGERFGVKKSHFNDFSRYSRELEERCVIDTEINARLYKYLKGYIENPRWIKPIELEHKVITICNTLRDTGFSFNLPLAKEYLEVLSSKVNTLRDSFKKAFPPKSKLIKTISPVLTKAGTLHSKDFRWLESKDLTPFSAEAPFSLFEFEEFNPSSPKQIVERLNAAGWRPVNKTKGHILAERENDREKLKEYAVYGWKVDEENLATLPEDAPEAARKLAEYLLLKSRHDDLVEWIGLYNPVSGRIHGTFHGIGSWTHRKSHQKPNMANIPALVNRQGKPQPWGPEFRSLWKASEGRVLVGCDAEGIQLRLFAHYCNDKKLIKAIENGKKEEKTDIHHLNLAVLDTICNSRDTAKTYIYALLLGAGTKKQAQILNCTPAQATEGLKRLLKFYPGWQELKDTRLRDDAKKGYFEGLDGRLVVVPDAHRILAGYLQNGESVVMKTANCIWRDALDELGVPYWQVNDVHDEWQTETLPEFAEQVGEIQAASITKVGKLFNLNCTLAGQYKIGSNWKETH